MKKFLTMLAAVGLTATASSAVVACSTTISAKNATVNPAGLMTIKDQKIQLVKEVKKGETIVASDYKVFDKDGNAITTATIQSISLDTTDGKATKDLKAKSEQKVNITIQLNVTKFDGDKKGQKIKLGSAKTDGKIDVTSTTIKFDTPKWGQASGQ